eukprot:scaffold36272_cov116-Isochrysis_galbana.AAC.2
MVEPHILPQPENRVASFQVRFIVVVVPIVRGRTTAGPLPPTPGVANQGIRWELMVLVSNGTD